MITQQRINLEKVTLAIRISTLISLKFYLKNTYIYKKKKKTPTVTTT